MVLNNKKISLYGFYLLLLFLFPTLTAHGKEPIDGAGDVLQYTLPVLALGSTLLNHDSEGRYQFYKSTLTCFTVTQGLKKAIDEERPNGHGHESFPSGHTSSAFLGASFMQRRYGWFYGVPSYLLASYVGWSRVDKKAHYIHDVLAGAAIGGISTWLFTTPLSKNIQVAPFVAKDAVGLGIRVKW